MQTFKRKRIMTLLRRVNDLLEEKESLKKFVKIVVNLLELVDGLSPVCWKFLYKLNIISKDEYETLT